MVLSSMITHIRARQCKGGTQLLPSLNAFLLSTGKAPSLFRRSLSHLSQGPPSPFLQCLRPAQLTRASMGVVSNPWGEDEDVSASTRTLTPRSTGGAGGVNPWMDDEDSSSSRCVF